MMRLMGYTIRVGRFVIECATPEEALALISKAEGTPSSQAQPAPPVRTPRAVATPKTVTGSAIIRRTASGKIIGAYAKAVQALLAHPEGITGADLSAAVGFEKITRLPGFMTAVRRELKRCGLPADQVIQKRRVYEDGSWVSRFSPSPKYVDDLRRLVA